MTHVTIPSNSSALHEYIKPYIIPLDEGTSKYLYEKVKVFINGAWVGITDKAIELYESLKLKKSKGIINIYASIVFDFKNKEIKICNDAGRLTRPLLRVNKENKLLLTKDIILKLQKEELSWDDLLIDCNIENSIIEYIDAAEQNNSMIGMNPKSLYKKISVSL